jgi:5-methylcytosine-specific restriction enzyme A
MAQPRRVLGRPWRRLIAAVIARKGDQCKLAYPGICLGTATTADHTIPVVEGGRDELSNLEPACVPCNRHKGRRITVTDASKASRQW